MLITGVMPLPAVMKSGRTGGGVGQHEVALRQAERQVRRRGRTSRTRCCDTRPPAIALTVIVMQPSSSALRRRRDRVGADVTACRRSATPTRHVLPGAMARASRGRAAASSVRASAVSSQHLLDARLQRVRRSTAG